MQGELAEKGMVPLPWTVRSSAEFAALSEACPGRDAVLDRLEVPRNPCRDSALHKDRSVTALQKVVPNLGRGSGSSKRALEGCSLKLSVSESLRMAARLSLTSQMPQK